MVRKRRQSLIGLLVEYKHIEIYGLLCFTEDGILRLFTEHGDAATPLSELGLVSCCAPMSVEYIVAIVTLRRLFYFYLLLSKAVSVKCPERLSLPSHHVFNIARILPFSIISMPLRPVLMTG